jgi:hypothetical protein
VVVLNTVLSAAALARDVLLNLRNDDVLQISLFDLVHTSPSYLLF